MTTTEPRIVESRYADELPVYEIWIGSVLCEWFDSLEAAEERLMEPSVTV